MNNTILWIVNFKDYVILQKLIAIHINQFMLVVGMYYA
jgi:hypothetical protein